ncbi:MAG: hypothetical protein HYY84_14645 [Deltaproteobacteria bacterium]|nr:hypothetical protein [Deltaproteobacteria bacterium]
MIQKLSFAVAASVLSLSGVAVAGAPAMAPLKITDTKVVVKPGQKPEIGPVLNSLKGFLPKKTETAKLKDDDRKEAECNHLSDLIANERKSYAYFKDQIDKTCRAKAFTEWVGDYRKIQGDYNKAVENLNKALASLNKKLAELKKKDPCTEQMDILDCAEAAEKLAASETKLASFLDAIKTARTNVAAVRTKRLAAEKADFYKDMEKCHQLDLAGEKIAARINDLIKKNGAALAKCKADLAEIQHDNLEFRKQTAIKTLVQTIKCKKLDKAVRDGIANSKKRDAALKAKNCMSDDRVASWIRAMNAGLAARDKALRAMPGANAGATPAQLTEFAKAARAFVAYRERVAKFAENLKKSADKCQGELKAMRVVDALLDGFLKNKRKDLRECNISLAGLRAQLAAANREIKD